MRSFGKWLGRFLLMAAVATLVMGVWKREELMRLWAVNSLFEPDRIVANFSNMDRAFLHAPVGPEAVSATPLPQSPALTLPDGMAAFLAAHKTTSLVVLQNGSLVYEDYYLDTGPDDLRIGWSLSKSFVSALMGVIVSQGHIPSLDAPVTDYAPQLQGGAYDGVSIRNVLNMATGVTFDEDYLDYDSDINRMGRILALGGTMDAFASSLTDTFATPGSDWQYVSIDTHVLGMVIRGATGRSITDLMGQEIVAPLGVERQPYYLTDGTGTAFVLGGLNMTSRDFARFGQMFLQRGAWQGDQIVPEDWVVASTEATAPTQPEEYGYGFQWWMPRDAGAREYLGRGIYGQYLYINEPSATVIVLTAADPDFRDRKIQDQHIAYFRAISAEAQSR